MSAKANKSKQVSKRGRKPDLRNAVIITLRASKRASGAELTETVGRKVSTSYLDALTKAGMVKVVDQVKSGHRGRPANVYSLDKRGHGMALNLARKAA